MVIYYYYYHIIMYYKEYYKKSKTIISAYILMIYSIYVHLVQVMFSIAQTISQVYII